MCICVGVCVSYSITLGLLGLLGLLKIELLASFGLRYKL